MARGSREFLPVDPREDRCSTTTTRRKGQREKKEGNDASHRVAGLPGREGETKRESRKEERGPREKEG